MAFSINFSRSITSSTAWPTAAATGEAGIGVEIPVPLAESVENLWAHDYRADGVAVTHGFAQGDDVRLQAVTLETPQGRARAAEAGLHFIGDEQTVGAVNHIDGGAQETGGSAKTPSLEKMLSTAKAENLMPLRFRSSIAAATWPAKVSDNRSCGTR